MQPNREDARHPDGDSTLTRTGHADPVAQSDRIAQVDRITQVDRLLPQTQCRRCGFEGCLPYARAIVTGSAAINRCPPGGEATMAALAQLLGTARLALDPDCGAVQPRRVAAIDNDACIGCTKCIAACPADAIVGAPGCQHHVLADRCTGCDLCLPPCPVDCIVMRIVGQAWSDADARRGRRHHRARLDRLARLERRSGALVAGDEGPPAAAASRDPRVALAAPAEKSRRLAAILDRVRSARRR